jgi:N-formylglutamate amidohydrolase
MNIMSRVSHYRLVIKGVIYSALLLAALNLTGCGKTIQPPASQEKPVIKEEPQQGFKRVTYDTGFIEYRTGNYPLIISIPHGGSLVTDNLPVRTKENCPDPSFTTVYDTYTPELGELVDSIVFARTGKYAHIIYCKLKRTYVDMNRQTEYAIPQGSTATKSVYDKYHDFIIEAKSSVTKSFGTGLILDFHSHGHAKQEVEIGYQLSSSVLNLNDNELNKESVAASSGIYNLYKSVSSKTTFSQLIRGDNSFGTIFYNNGVASIPSKQSPSPAETPYFSGGYITKIHGSGTSGTIDAIQLEFHSDCRREPSVRKVTAEQLVKTVDEFFKINYIFK